jgi:hypothetical protein
MPMSNADAIKKASGWFGIMEGGSPENLLNESADDKWFDENKNSDKLRNAFQEYVIATQKAHNNPISYRDWAVTIYKKTLTEANGAAADDILNYITDPATKDQAIKWSKAIKAGEMPPESLDILLKDKQDREKVIELCCKA